MAKAVLCPVCNGSGKVYEPPLEGSTGTGYYKTCHGCGGKGWVEVPESDYNPIEDYPKWHHPKGAMIFFKG